MHKNTQQNLFQCSDQVRLLRHLARNAFVRENRILPEELVDLETFEEARPIGDGGGKSDYIHAFSFLQARLVANVTIAPRHPLVQSYTRI